MGNMVYGRGGWDEEKGKCLLESAGLEFGGGVMKSYRKELWFNIQQRRGFVNITLQVEA